MLLVIIKPRIFVQSYILVKLTKIPSVKYIFYFLFLNIIYQLPNSWIAPEKYTEIRGTIFFNESSQFHLFVCFTRFSELSTRIYFTNVRSTRQSLDRLVYFINLISFYSRARGIVQVVTRLPRVTSAEYTRSRGWMATCRGWCVNGYSWRRIVKGETGF